MELVNPLTAAMTKNLVDFLLNRFRKLSQFETTFRRNTNAHKECECVWKGEREFIYMYDIQWYVYK